MHLGDLRPAQGAKKRRKRVGRGMGSGHGKTSTRGMKGQKARYSVRPGKSARNLGIFRRNYAEVNVGRLDDRFDAGTVVTPELLQQQGIVRGTIDGLRVLGQGQLAKALTIRAHHFSASARAKIEAAGGTAEVI